MTKEEPTVEFYVCGEEHPHNSTFIDDIFCTREKGHPGQHCRFKLDYGGYHNIWWEDKKKETDTDDN